MGIVGVWGFGRSVVCDSLGTFLQSEISQQPGKSGSIRNVSGRPLAILFPPLAPLAHRLVYLLESKIARLLGNLAPPFCSPGLKCKLVG